METPNADTSSNASALRRPSSGGLCAVPPGRDYYDARHDQEVTVARLDTMTGETKEVSGSSSYWWAEGNGMCDCNRAIKMGHADVGEAMCGEERYLIVACDADIYSLREFNEDWPAALLNKHLPPTGA